MRLNCKMAVNTCILLKKKGGRSGHWGQGCREGTYWCSDIKTYMNIGAPSWLGRYTTQSQGYEFKPYIGHAAYLKKRERQKEIHAQR